MGNDILALGPDMPDSSSSSRRKRVLEALRTHPYWAAATFVVIATLVRFLLDPLIGKTAYPFITFFAAVAAAGYLGGWWPSLLAIALSYSAAAWCFIEPRGSLWSSNRLSDITGLVTFVFVTSIIAWLTELLRKARETETRRSRRVAQILESIADAFVTLDTEYRITYMNPEAERIVGKKLADLKGRSHWDEFPEARGTELGKQYRTTMEKPTPISLEYYHEPWRKWFYIGASP